MRTRSALLLAAVLPCAFGCHLVLEPDAYQPDPVGTDGGAPADGQNDAIDGGPTDGSMPESLRLTEVYYDHAPEDDDGYEWVKIHNGSQNAIDLAGHALGWGGVDYTYGTLQLSGSVNAGDCYVVGGPERVAENGEPTYDKTVQLTPTLQNVTDADGTADGVALFSVRADQIAPATLPIDAVIYGETNTSGLIDASGQAPPPHVGAVQAGASIRLVGGSWSSSTPAPDACP